jgi:flagellar biosynthesis/type III secretory pathway protein FliH
MKFPIDKKVEDLKAYQAFHDKVPLSKSALLTSYEEGYIQGYLESFEKDYQKGYLIGLEKEKEEVILKAYARQMSIADIAAFFDYEEAEVLLVLQKHGIL